VCSGSAEKARVRCCCHNDAGYADGRANGVSAQRARARTRHLKAISVMKQHIGCSHARWKRASSLTYTFTPAHLSLSLSLSHTHTHTQSRRACAMTHHLKAVSSGGYPAGHHASHADGVLRGHESYTKQIEMMRLQQKFLQEPW
jgi:hypothetical protein